MGKSNIYLARFFVSSCLIYTRSFCNGDTLCERAHDFLDQPKALPTAKIDPDPTSFPIVSIRKPRKRKLEPEIKIFSNNELSQEGIEIICKFCRKDRKSNHAFSQQTLSKFLTGHDRSKSPGDDNSTASLFDNSAYSDDSPHDASNLCQEKSALLCVQCRRMMEEGKPSSGIKTLTKTAVCPSITKLRSYKKIAESKGIRWELQDSEAQAIMRQPCAFCGQPASENSNGINGINRLDHAVRRFSLDNVASACRDCNQMKHNHTAEGFRAICRHLATRAGLLPPAASGLHPEAFRDCWSRKTRSSYLTKSKTHAIRKEDFEAIVAQPCHYCGKPSVPGRHYNGLDRIVTQIRVYSAATVVSCCGTCNTMKWRRRPDDFLRHCANVALHTASLPSSAASAVELPTVPPAASAPAAGVPAAGPSAGHVALHTASLTSSAASAAELACPAVAVLAATAPAEVPTTAPSARLAETAVVEATE